MSFKNREEGRENKGRNQLKWPKRKEDASVKNERKRSHRPQEPLGGEPYGGDLNVEDGKKRKGQNAEAN